jgi:hypothetical protein
LPIVVIKQYVYATLKPLIYGQDQVYCINERLRNQLNITIFVISVTQAIDMPRFPKFPGLGLRPPISAVNG